MAEVRTATFSSGDIVTTHNGSESVRDWVARHNDALKNQTPTSDPLVTTWPIKDPPYTASTSTVRDTNETDAEFIDRHVQDYLLDMMDENPDPS